MPLILAIEPDRRQAAHLAGVIRNRVRAELVLADTTERALNAIGSRVPDLVLVPALLSPQDDAALAAALRVIAAAAHVRTLTTPLLASTTKPTSRGGVLATWRRGRTKSPAPDGCDPAVFAEQMTAYLKEAAAERAELKAVRNLSADVEVPTDDVVQAAVAEPVQVEPAIRTPAGEVEPAIVAPASEAESAIVTPASDDAPVVIAPVLIAQPSVVMPVHVAVAAAVADATEVWASSEDVIDLSDLSQRLPDLSDEPALRRFFDDETGETYTIPSVPKEPAIEVFDLLPMLLERAAVHEPVVATPVSQRIVEEPVVAAGNEPAVEFVDQAVAAVAAEPDVEPERPEIDLWMPLPLGTNRSWPRLEGIQAEAAPVILEPEEAAPVVAQPEADLVVARPDPASAVVATQPKAPPAEGLPDRPPWVELIESLRLDIERLRAERLQPPPVVVAANPDEGRAPSFAPVVTATPPSSISGVAQGEKVVRKPKRRSKKPKPIQDEWGFFDPEQCGFAALLAKLDEITDCRDEPDARPPA